MLRGVNVDVDVGFDVETCSLRSRAAPITGPYPNRSGLTTVSGRDQGGGLPPAEWTLASVLKLANYKTFFAGKWHLGEDDNTLPNAHGFDVMKFVYLYHGQSVPRIVRTTNRQLG
jgi:arylsulfatase A-like enzyme